MARIEIVLMRALAVVLLAIALMQVPDLMNPERRLIPKIRDLPPTSNIRQEFIYQIRNTATNKLLQNLLGGLALLGLAGIRQDLQRLIEALEE